MDARSSEVTATTERVREHRRDFVKKLAYVAPLLLTLPANPAAARVGSGPPPRCETDRDCTGGDVRPVVNIDYR
jgi:hypothetical protein